MREDRTLHNNCSQNLTSYTHKKVPGKVIKYIPADMMVIMIIQNLSFTLSIKKLGKGKVAL
jgi:hypothetical protein